MRRGVRDLLEAEDDLEVVGEAGTAEEAYARIPATPPDVAVLDVRLPDGDGVEVCREIRSRHPELAVPDADLVRRRRGAVQRDHGRRVGLPAEAGAGHRPGRRDASGRSRRVAAGPGADRPSPASGCASPAEPDELAGLTEQERRILDLHRRGADQPSDRRADVPGGEDGEELRVEPAGEARA